MNKIDIANVAGKSYCSIASCKGNHNAALSIVNDLDDHSSYYQVNNYNTDEELRFEFDQAGKEAAVEQFNEWTR